MEYLPQVEPNCGRITNLFYQTISSRLLITAIQLNIFDHLEKPVTADQVTFSLTSHLQNTTILLDALCAFDLVAKKNNQYQNTKEASELLVTGKPAYIGDWLVLTDKEQEHCLQNLKKLVISGPGSCLTEKHMNSETYCERFTASHAATSLAGIARDMAKEIAAVPQFKKCHRILDLGGGPGINAMAVVEMKNDLKATVIDRPDIIKFTHKYIQNYGFGKRVTAVAGDYLKDSIGSNYDMIMITDSLYYIDQEVDTVLKKCRSALNPGGFLVGIHAVLTHERTAPSDLVLGMLPDALSGQGMLPDKGFFEHALERCGFSTITSKMISVGGAPWEMNIGYVNQTTQKTDGPHV